MKEKEIERLNLLKAEELKLYNDEIQYICGIDEAGRGPLAGPLVVAACVLPKGYDNSEINDSKKQTKKKREALFALIKEVAVSYVVKVVSIDIIDVIIINVSIQNHF